MNYVRKHYEKLITALFICGVISIIYAFVYNLGITITTGQGVVFFFGLLIAMEIILYTDKRRIRDEVKVNTKLKPKEYMLTGVLYFLLYCAHQYLGLIKVDQHYMGIGLAIEFFTLALMYIRRLQQIGD